MLNDIQFLSLLVIRDTIIYHGDLDERPFRRLQAEGLVHRGHVGWFVTSRGLDYLKDN